MNLLYPVGRCNNVAAPYCYMMPAKTLAQGTGTLTGQVAVPTAQAITAQATGPTLLQLM